MKILTIVGARPQFIKAATVSRAFKAYPSIHEIILHTGQHYDANMSDVFFEQMEIPKPEIHLGIKSALHGQMTGRMIEGIEDAILKIKPDGVLLYGDTNSTLAGALAACKLFIKIIHVEAGLRSFNMHMPEEINRILTDRVSDLLCCPTRHAVENLEREGFENFKATIVQTGDVMYDAALHYSERSQLKSKIMSQIGKDDFILVTMHRAENTNDPQRLTSIVEALNEIHKRRKVVLPLHPRTAKNMNALKLKVDFSIIEPQSYFDMLELLKSCSLVITDSGGLQKEAYFFKKQCICLRDETEWIELLEGNHVFLAGADKSKIIMLFNELYDKPARFDEFYYGIGNASSEVVRAIRSI